MGAVVDRLSLDPEDVKTYLRVDHDADDDIIEMLVDSAKEHADEFLNNEFTHEDEDGEEVEDDIPAPIKMWVLKRVARNYERRSEGLSSAGGRGSDSANWGDEEYTELMRYRLLPGV
jgi:uncharacterized phage protein (predicted DNA packaging)